MSKDSLLLYRNQLQIINAMPTAEQGLEFLNAIAGYVFDGVKPDINDPILAIAWASVESLIERDIERYRTRCERNAKNGAKGGRPKNPTEPKKASGFLENPEEPKKADNDNDNENDNENDNDILINNCRVEPDAEEQKTTYGDQIAEIIDYLNQKTGKKFKAKAKATRAFIEARLKEGYSVDDFKQVIDIKVREWQGTPQDQYLRPETLFRPSHFESYLNQKSAVRYGSPRNTFNSFEQHDFDVHELFKQKKRGVQ